MIEIINCLNTNYIGKYGMTAKLVGSLSVWSSHFFLWQCQKTDKFDWGICMFLCMLHLAMIMWQLPCILCTCDKETLKIFFSFSCQYTIKLLHLRLWTNVRSSKNWNKLKEKGKTKKQEDFSFFMPIYN